MVVMDGVLQINDFVGVPSGYSLISERMSLNNKVNPNNSQSDIDEIEDLIYASIQSGPTTVMPAEPLTPQTSIPVSTSPFMASNNPPSYQIPATVSVPPLTLADTQPNPHHNAEVSGLGAASNTLTEPVWDTVKRYLNRIVSNLKLVVFPNPFREDPGKALRDWDLWGPFFFIVFLGLVLSWSASVKKGGHIIFFQSLSLLGYCLFPLDVGALLCMLKDSVILKMVVVSISLAWSSWAAYPFMSAAVSPGRKALALYPVFLMYVSVGFLVIAID